MDQEDRNPASGYSGTRVPSGAETGSDDILARVEALLREDEALGGASRPGTDTGKPSAAHPAELTFGTRRYDLGSGLPGQTDPAAGRPGAYAPTPSAAKPAETPVPAAQPAAQPVYAPRPTVRPQPVAQPVYVPRPAAQPQPGAQPVYAPRPAAQPVAQPVYVPRPAVQAQPGVQSVYPARPAAAGQTPPRQPAKPAPKKKQKRYGGWIALAIVMAVLLGVVGGIFGYRLLADRQEEQTASDSPQSSAPKTDATPGAVPDATQGNGDISQKVTIGQPADYTAPAEIYRNNLGAVVGIANEGTTTNIWGQASATASSGTGFIISEDGYILTNYHVAKGADTLTVTCSDGTSYPARLVGYESVTCDVALLKIDASGLPAVKFGNSDQLQVGDQVCTIGNPLGELTYTLTVGYVSAKERAINTDGNPISMLQTDAAINAGNSGGPLFDMSGNVVGIVTAKYSGSTTSGASIEGLGFAIPINAVLDLIDDLEKYGFVTNRPYLGVQVTDAAAIQDQDLPAGAYISSVVEGNCAQKAGIQAGDVIIGMDGKTINSYETLVTVLNSHRAGQTVEITLWRSGRELTVTLTFDQRPRDLDEADASKQPQPTDATGSDDPFGFILP